jgi:CRISPR system Cascade subunit CasD
MQSWGTTSRFDERDTQLEPSKSGVLGLICAALGRDRSEPVKDLAALRMGVRVDREGIMMRDFQTAAGVFLANGKVKEKRTVVSPRFYLADAAFLVGLEAKKDGLLNDIQKALALPVWPLSLGRKSFTPGSPVLLKDGLQNQDLLSALTTYPRLAFPQHGQQNNEMRIAIEDFNEGSVRLDQPVAPFSERRFGSRYVKPGVVHVLDQVDA